MFARKNRYSFKKGVPKQFVASQFFSLYFRKNEDNILHCAVVVGKKVDKRATVRNKIKRLVNVNLRDILNIATPYDVVIYARPGIKNLAEENIKEELSVLLKKLT